MSHIPLAHLTQHNKGLQLTGPTLLKKWLEGRDEAILLRLKWREGQGERTVTHITSFQLFLGQCVQSQLLLVPCCPHSLSPLASLDKTNNQSISWRTHACYPPTLLGPMGPQLPCHFNARDPRCIQPTGRLRSDPVITTLPSKVPSWTCAQPEFLPSSCIPSSSLKLKLFSQTLTPISQQDSNDLCKELPPRLPRPQNNLSSYLGALILLMLIHSFPTLKAPQLTHSEGSVIC